MELKIVVIVIVSLLLIFPLIVFIIIEPLIYYLYLKKNKNRKYRYLEHIRQIIDINNTYIKTPLNCVRKKILNQYIILSIFMGVIGILMLLLLIN